MACQVAVPVDSAGVIHERRHRQLASAAHQEAGVVGVGQSAQSRRAATQAHRPDGERRDLAERDRARAIERQVGFLERGQGRIGDRAVVGRLEAGVILLAAVALNRGQYVDIECAAGTVALQLHGAAGDRRQLGQLDVAAG